MASILSRGIFGDTRSIRGVARGVPLNILSLMDASAWSDDFRVVDSGTTEEAWQIYDIGSPVGDSVAASTTESTHGLMVLDSGTISDTGVTICHTGSDNIARFINGLDGLTYTYLCRFKLDDANDPLIHLGVAARDAAMFDTAGAFQTNDHVGWFKTKSSNRMYFKSSRSGPPIQDSGLIDSGVDLVDGEWCTVAFRASYNDLSDDDNNGSYQAAIAVGNSAMAGLVPETRSEYINGVPGTWSTIDNSTTVNTVQTGTAIGPVFSILTDTAGAKFMSLDYLSIVAGRPV